MSDSTKSTNSKTFKDQLIQQYQLEFGIWGRCHESMEEAVVRERDLSTPFARALDVLFVQAFKSHGSVYFLCAHGQGEDAATITRRILEICFQVSYLCAIPDEREDRGTRYLAWFWTQTQQRAKSGLPPAEAKQWQADYDAHKHLLIGTNGKPLKNWWGNLTLRNLKKEVDLENRYDRDYRFLSQASHCTALGLMFFKPWGIFSLALIAYWRVVGYSCGRGDRGNSHSILASHRSARHDRFAQVLRGGRRLAR